MPTIVFIQDSEFNLQPITINGGTINGRYILNANGTWSWNVSVAGIPGLNFTPSQNNVADQALASTLCTIGVQAAIDLLSALPTPATP